MKLYSILLRVNQPNFRKSVTKISHRLLKASAIGACTVALLVGNESYCAGNEGDTPTASGDNTNNNANSDGASTGGRKKPDEMEKYIKSLQPVFEQLGFGGIMGYFSGYALKRIGKIAAFCIGLGFVAFQGVKYYTGSKQLIDLDKLKCQVEKKIDQDGDGKFGTSDLVVIWNKFHSIMTQNLPSSSGFSGGFLLALYSA